ncbi:hypothetical protein JQ557_02045 [Bradyrhizobium sp. U87765 SZCCT0131]|uniref:hypothetical protein n=1 Tax=unclassified Bradyrhizobium TaxID=2631580 RepID=UPI001BAAE0BB|nr:MULTISPECIES: hypothetical protein [unclassified Bradyrhizobium]MBR1216756.1 hypothetical protein [Bradyrhizobium sp. U87765 SZCCT0131]MBR1259488.1 hypothetical protein [Bradyrhizobium sp. U87765 SZCCT0134]MBR1305629.1 hypothetical protein [Bradyrhizobium sp. U87765 SZCCT0110]MBR1321996.1 hypothetical protein [Bradyrhizobium sp. U87765 SZCCT0109]MBR1350726.1 hypothetical protein [Bradyrhizobium sp. U87765 SZCCT0048]
MSAASNPAPAGTRHPTLYELSGGGLQITYSTSGFDGRPHFSYHSASLNKQFSGDQIRSTASELGTLVSVVLHETTDAGSTTFTVLIPRVNLRLSDIAPVATESITTLHRGSIVGQPNGQADFYTVQALSGTAAFVVF